MIGYLRIERTEPLRVADLNLRCVGFVAEAVGGTASDEERDLKGTGFFVGVPSAVHQNKNFLYFVTAKHLIADLKDRIDRVRVVVNKTGGGTASITMIDGRWWFHPNDPTTDVAILACKRPYIDVDVYVLTKEFLTPELIKQKNIGIGDEVFLTGLFDYATSPKRIMPIVRYGNIAMLPTEQIQTELGFADVYLVEARSAGGISGSPVFARQTIPLCANVAETPSAS
jgi:hypothetical protein